MIKQTVLLITTLVLTSSIKAESINEIALIESIKASCAINKEIYQKCFAMSENECKALLTEVIPECSVNKNVFPADDSTSTKFIECVSKKFEKKLVSKGIQLDEPCAK